MEILGKYVVVIVMATCLAIGYIIKHSLDFIPNKYIPLIMAILGVLLNVWVNKGAISIEILLGGLASGLASTGAFEAIRNITNTSSKTDENK